MSSPVDEIPALNRTPAPAEIESRVSPAVGIALCLLLALAQIAYAGYQLGVGNQSIQIAFLRHLANPALFAQDPMVTQTMPLYPTYFFRLLAPLLHISALESLYLFLQLLTSFFTLSTVYLLSRSIFKSHAAALAAAALLVAGHHRALAGDGLYSAGFTHTFFALPLALVALALAYRRRTFWAFVVAGILFNLHALTAAYALLMIAFASLANVTRASCPPVNGGVAEDVRAGFPRYLKTLTLSTLAFLLLASPTLFLMFSHHQTFDAAWVNLMRVRSADHSFPSTWWAAGDPDIPRFALIFALFVLSWSFSPVRRGGGADTTRALRMTILMTLAVALLFAVGYVFTELYPLPLIIRLQPFRASRLMMVLMFVHIAYGSVAAIRAGFTGKTLTNSEPSPKIENQKSKIENLSPASRLLEPLAGLLVLLTLAIPALLPLLPITLLVVLLAALTSARLSIMQSLTALAALLLALIAWPHIQFPLPFLSRNLSLLPQQNSLDSLALIPLAAATILAILFAFRLKPRYHAALLAATLFLGSALTWQLFLTDLNPDLPAQSPAAALAPAARWARSQTPVDSLFLAPTGLPSFRIFAQRALVGDWRDGTQLYFSANFGPDWLARLTALEPGLLLSPDGSRLVARGRSLATLDDDELLALAQKYHANYILLPTPPSSHPRTLQVAYADHHFTAYLPQIAPAEVAIPKGVINPAEWTAMEKFMATTVAQNIEKYRKSDVTLQIVDPEGRPVQDLPATLNQTAHAFYFGTSMSFFEPNDTPALGDQKAPPMTPAELKLIPTLFNASMIAFTGKWMYIEPNDGDRHYEDLDKYFDYCQQNHLAVEYHFLTGLLPEFLRKDQKLAAQRLPEHAREIVARYHDRVTFWQVANDGYLIHSTPDVFKELRPAYPNIKLGLSDCVRFFSDRPDPKTHDHEMFKGFDDLLWLKSQGVQPDFYSLHGHAPAGLWADPREMYKVFDRYQAEGCKVHISEFLIPLGSDIVGNVRKGKWLPTLQADYLERFLTVCFSHPDVEMVNLWGIGPHNWGASGGLVDTDLKPRPAFDRALKLFNETWHTRVETTLPLDGLITTRAFHGAYSLTLTLPDGRLASTTFNLPTNSPSTKLKFTLDPQSATLTPYAPPQENPTPAPAPAHNPS